MLDSNRARIDNTATLRSGAVNRDPSYAVSESGIWKLTFEYLEADPTSKATTGNSPQGVVSAAYDAVIARRCEEAKRHLDTATRALFEREKFDFCAVNETVSYKIFGAIVMSADTASVYVTLTFRDGSTSDRYLQDTTRENGTWKIHFDSIN
jgi:hypothetical protein